MTMLKNIISEEEKGLSKRIAKISLNLAPHGEDLRPVGFGYSLDVVEISGNQYDKVINNTGQINELILNEANRLYNKSQELLEVFPESTIEMEVELYDNNSMSYQLNCSTKKRLP
jgi:hypothetical protein